MDKTWFALIAFVLGWLVAQVWKAIDGLIKGYRTDQNTSLASLIGYVTRSGGMPSGHTASLTAMVVCFGYMLGYNSPAFILGIGVWLIVVYDAINVRYAVGEQGKALNGLLETNKRPILPIVEGHTVPQVIVGAIIGIVIGLGVGYLAVL